MWTSKLTQLLTGSHRELQVVGCRPPIPPLPSKIVEACWQVVVAAGAVGVLVKVLRRFLEEAEDAEGVAPLDLFGAQACAIRE